MRRRAFSILTSFLADPCRFLEFAADWRQLDRLWHALRRRGAQAVLSEFSVSKAPPVVRPAVFEPHDRRAGSGGILVIDAAIPEYDKHAGARASFAYLKLLAEMGVPLWFLPNDLLRREPYATELEVLGIRLLTGSGYGCGRWHRWLAAQGQGISHVLIHRPNVALRHLASLRRLTRAKLIYMAHDLRHVREARHFQVSGDAFHRREAAYWQAQEQRLLSLVDVAYFFSDQEVALCRSWSSAQLRRVPMFPDLACAGAVAESWQPDSLLFVGSFAHQPNVDAVRWFVADILPLVRHHRPAIQLHIVGADAPWDIFALQDQPGIRLHGRISDDALRQLYRQVTLVVAPLRFGAGVKGKVVEALAYGLPVVTTPIGAEGIPDAASVLDIHTAPQELADAIITLCQDSSRLLTRRQAITGYSQAHFSAQEAKRILRLDFEAA